MEHVNRNHRQQKMVSVEQMKKIVPAFFQVGFVSPNKEQRLAMAWWSTMTIQTLLRISSTMISVSQAQATMRSLKWKDLHLHARPDPSADRNIVTIDMTIPNGKTTAAKGKTVVLASSEDAILNPLIFLLALAEHNDAMSDGCDLDDLFFGELAPAGVNFDFDLDAVDENVIRGVHLADRDILPAQVRLWLKAAGAWPASLTSTPTLFAAPVLSPLMPPEHLTRRSPRSSCIAMQVCALSIMSKTSSEFFILALC